MKKIVQIELTNACNRSCTYCGIPTMTRKKAFMTQATFSRCVDVLQELGQDEVGINHYGESTMHPKYVEFIRQLNDKGIKPFIYTNGDFLTDELIAELATCKLKFLIISGHMLMEERVALWEKCQVAGIAESYYQVTLTEQNTLSLAGQRLVGVDAGETPLIDPQNHCRFLVEEMAVVLVNGDLTPCCVDYDGKGVFGSIFNFDVAKQKTPAFSLCDTCPGHPGNVV